MEDDTLLVEWNVKILRNGDVINDTLTFNNSFAEVYRGLIAVRNEIDRQIRERKNCPFNPKFGNNGRDLGPDNDEEQNDEYE